MFDPKPLRRHSQWLLSILISLIAVAGRADDKLTLIDPPELGFFSKQLLVHGIPIKAHKDVSDEAMLEAHKRINRLLEHLPEATANLVDVGSELQIIGKDQATSDLPELRHFKGKVFSRNAGKTLTIDERTRGVGGLNCSCGEENLLKLPSDRYRDHRDICSHEFSHTLLAHGLSENVREMVKAQYKRSMDKGLWKGMYAATNYDEFFAELTMWYFDSRGDYGPTQPRPTPGPEWFRKYDPESFAMMDDIYSGRVKVERQTWELLEPTIQEEKQMHTIESETSASIVIENRSSVELKLFWLDPDGKRKDYGNILPGERTSRTTYVSHPWVLVKPDGDGSRHLCNQRRA